MQPTEPLQLHHSWPLFEREKRFELGQVIRPRAWFKSQSGDDSIHGAELARRGIGLWACDLSDNSLTWSAAVYDIFGLQRGTAVRRDEAVGLYAEDSRAAMERLRAYAIKHQRGFTLDAEIRPAQGPARWMRLIAAPVCEGDRVVRLTGLKLLI